MRLITMRMDYDNLVVTEDRVQGSRREWTVTGQLDIYLDGAFDKLQYDSAANMAQNIALEMNIPLTQLVRVVSFKTRSVKRSDKQGSLL